MTPSPALIADLVAANHILYDHGVVDAFGHRNTVTYDALNRLQATVDALGDRTTFAYDAAGELTSVVDPLSNKTTLVYDAREHAIGLIKQEANAIGADDVVGTLHFVRQDLADVVQKRRAPDDVDLGADF